MIRTIFFFLITLTSIDNNAFSTDKNIDSLLVMLDKTISEQMSYTIQKERKIKNLKYSLDTARNQKNEYYIINDIITEYRNYKLDSTLKYVEKNLKIARELNNSDFIIKSNFNAIYILGMSGRYINALNFLGEFNRAKLSKKYLSEYYTICYNLYDRLKEEDYTKQLKEHYSVLTTQYKDSLVTSISKKSNQYLALLELDYLGNQEFEKSLQINTQRLEKVDPNPSDYALILFYRALIFRKLGKIEMAKYYYILSAITDIHNSNKNSASLTELSRILYNQKKLQQASKYVNIAMEDALFYNSRYRYIFLSSVLPIINEAYQTEIRAQNLRLRAYSLIATLLTILFLSAICYIYVQLKKLTKTRNELKEINLQLKKLNEELNSSNFNLNNTIHQLKEANHIKEEYIGSFLRICSNYINKLNLYRKKVRSEIANKRVKELFEFSKSNKLIENEITEFYTYFDNTFLSIYPNFLKEFNNLLINGEQIVLKKGELLNTELRIFALIRLGIHDSSKIAELLRYSVNTIYNYRAKIKNKAKNDRELFETRVLNIGAHID